MKSLPDDCLAATLTAGYHTPNYQDLFVISTTGRLFHTWFDGPNEHWSDWEELTTLVNIDAIAHSSIREQHQEIFVAANGQVAHRWLWHGKGWSEWHTMKSLPDDCLAATLTAGYHTPNYQDLFVISTTGRLFHTWFDGPNEHWSDWEELTTPR